MSYEEKIDQLVSTVRTLNFKVRPRATNTPGGDPGAGQLIHSLLAELRDNELRASQDVKRVTLGDAFLALEAGRDVVRSNPDEIGTLSLLSEFTTVRESILSSVRTYPADQWESQHETPDGPITMTSVVDGLIGSDKTYVTRIDQAQSG